MADAHVSSISDDDLLRRVVNTAKRQKGEPKWAAVGRKFALGSTFSIQLCHRFGLDPWETGK
mgnify:CR=1 FL=1